MRARVRKIVVWQIGVLAFAATWLFGISGRSVVASAPPARLPIHITIADFDGDRRPDLASVEIGQSTSLNTRYWIAFHLSAGASQALGITAPTGGLQITSRDVNGDSFPDVVITTAWTNQPVAILLNDGFGNFTASNPSEFPSAFAGSTASCTAAVNEIRDATALVLSRCIPGDCWIRRRTSSLPAAARLPAPGAVSASLVASVLLSIGRAPPV